MKVFIYCDNAGGIGVYNVDTYDQAQTIFGRVVSDLNGDPEEIKGMDVYDIMNYLQEQLGFSTNNRGGKAQVLDVKTQMDQLVEP